MRLRRLRPRVFAGQLATVLAAFMPSVFVTVAPGQSPAPPSRPAAILLGIKETQVSIELGSDRERSRFQGTILAKSGGRLTVLTAAHCLTSKDVGKSVRIGRGDDTFRAL